MRSGVHNMKAEPREFVDSCPDSGACNGPLSSALATMFRGKLCDVVLWNRSATIFEKDHVIYDVGEEKQMFFFVQKGFVKVGSVMRMANGLWTHTKGGFYHDGRFSTLMDVVNHYDSCLGLSLSDQDKADLVEFLKSLPREKKD